MIKILEYDKEKQILSFISDMPVSLANAIRRSVLEIPILGIDEVEIIKNDSALYDEIIAHRIGLIPIKNEKGLEKASYKLKAKGPGTVYSTDIEPSIGLDYKMPIVILNKGQELEMNLYAKKGKGIEHIKYSPGLMNYRHNLNPELIEFVYIDEEGNVSYDEEELKELGMEEKKEEIKKIKKVNELVFEVESWGQIDVKEIFLEAIKALKANLKEFSKSFS